MKLPDYTKIDSNHKEWLQHYQNNINRGCDFIDFTNCGNQWQGDVVGTRKSDGKESLTLSLCDKVQEKVKSDFSKLQFSLNLFSRDTKNVNIEQDSTFKKLFNHWVLCDEMQRSFADAWDKCIDFGYSFLEVSFKRESDENFDLSPDVIFHEDPSIAFWDLRAQKKTKIDGDYCGIRTVIGEEELSNKMPGIKVKLKEKGNDVIRYWFRRQEKVLFYQMKNGQYKREDLIDMDNPSEVDQIERDALGVKLATQDYVSCIYYTVIVNERIVKKPVKWPTKDLPLVYHHGRTVWKKSKSLGVSGLGVSYETFPYTYRMRDIQVAHNYAWSQAATLIRSVTSQKFLFTPTHLQSQLSQQYAKEISTLEGGAVFGTNAEGKFEPVQIVEPMQIPQTLLEFINMTKQEADELNGAFIDQNANNTVIAGVAIDKITKNMSLGATCYKLIAAQVQVISDCASLIQQMIPEICSTQRSILVRKKDNSYEEVFINRKTSTQGIQNNIRDIGNKYIYTIEVAPTEEMQSEASIMAIDKFYNSPQTPVFAATQDLYADQLPIQNKEEFMKRITAYMDQNLLKYSDGQITKDDFLKMMSQQKEMMTQMQNQQLQAQLQAQNIMAYAEKMKADSMQYNEITKRMKAESEMQHDSRRLEVDLVKHMNDKNFEAKKLDAEIERDNRDFQQAALQQFIQSQQPVPPVETPEQNV